MSHPVGGPHAPLVLELVLDGAKAPGNTMHGVAGTRDAGPAAPPAAQGALLAEGVGERKHAAALAATKAPRARSRASYLLVTRTESVDDLLHLVLECRLGLIGPALVLQALIISQAARRFLQTAFAFIYMLVSDAAAPLLISSPSDFDRLAESCRRQRRCHAACRGHPLKRR